MALSAKAIGKRIRKTREQQGKTTAGLARASGFSKKQIEKIERGDFDAKGTAEQLRYRRAPELAYRSSANLKVESPQREWRKEIGRRIDHALTFRGMPWLFVASTIGLKVSDLLAMSQGKREPTGHEGLALSVVLLVGPDWLAAGGVVPITPERIDEISHDASKPATFRELILLAKTLRVSPFALQWGSEKNRPRKRRAPAA